MLFFATGEELESGLAEYERETGCSWYRCRSEESTSDLGPLRREEAFPELGVSPTGQQATDPFALSLHREASPVVREVRLRAGGRVFMLQQDLNPDSIVVSPGGVFLSSAIVAGRAATISESRPASELFKAFQLIVLRGFRKVGQYRVGPGVELLAATGTRLVTMGIDEALEYDLRLDGHV